MFFLFAVAAGNVGCRDIKIRCVACAIRRMTKNARTSISSPSASALIILHIPPANAFGWTVPIERKNKNSIFLYYSTEKMFFNRKSLVAGKKIIRGAERK